MDMFFFERTIYRHRFEHIPDPDESPEIANGSVILSALTHADADAFFTLYRRTGVMDDTAGSPFLPDDTPDRFAARVASKCEMLWTIRLVENPNVIVGDCALHHWNKKNREIGFGGILLPEYWGNGIMAIAFQLAADYAKSVYNVTSFRCVTTNSNHKALRFADKMGFTKIPQIGNTILLKKNV